MKEMALGGSVLILVLAALRRVLRKKLDPRLRYALWLLVAARLLIPGVLLTSPAGLPAAETDPAAAAGAALDSVLNWGKDVPLVTYPYPGSERIWTPSWVPEEDLGGEIRGDVHGNTTYMLTASWTGFFRFWMPVVWIAGMAAMALRLVLANWSFYLRLYVRRRRLDLPPDAGTGKLRVYTVRGLESPCLFGLLRPAVYLDDRDLSPERLRHILVHEATHYRHRDHIWGLVRCACLVVHWFNPLVWWAAAMSRRDCELACDAGVLDRLGEAERLDYGGTLLAAASGRGSLRGLLRTSTAMNESKRTMKERINMIVDRPQMLRITLALVLAVAAAATACAFSGREVEAELPPDDASTQTDLWQTPAGLEQPEPNAAGFPEPSRPAGENARETGDRILELIGGGTEVSEWLSLLEDLDWSAAFRLGREEDWIMLILDELYDYTRAPESVLTDGDYLVIFSADEGLDGAYSEMYQDVIWNLYRRDPDRFVRLLQEGMDDEHRALVLWWVKGALLMDGYIEAESIGMITDQKALSLLADPLTAVYVDPYYLHFDTPGQTIQIVLQNTAEDCTVTYTCDDLAVAVVSEDGAVTAVGPGTADIRIHFEGYGGARDLYCYVDCEE